MSSTPLAAILIGYLVFLFLVAAVAERFGRRLSSPRLQTLTYVLAVSVYCTAWTFYGSVGLAANRGLEFLTIYLGPALVALLWPTVLRKLVRVAKEQRITTISDFVASRYGKSAPLGTLVAVLVVCGMIPYIALQLKAVSVSFAMMIGGNSVLSGFDPALLVAAMLALFGILFGARNLDFTRAQTGLMSAVAVESIVKLVAFLLVGGFVTWGLFDGFADIFSRIVDHPEWSSLLTLGTAPAASYARWTAMLLVSMAAVMLLPRQFHVLVVQNPRERDVATAAWAFPLYLLAINVFVLPIAFAGLLRFPGQARGRRQLHPRPSHHRRRPGGGGGRFPRRLLRGHGHDRGRLARPVEDDLQRHHSAGDPPSRALRRGLLGQPGLDPPGHPRGGRARLLLGAHRGGALPARGDGAALLHRRHPVRPRGVPRALLAPG